MRGTRRRHAGRGSVRSFNRNERKSHVYNNMVARGGFRL